MVKFTIDELAEIMTRRNNIRNISVIAHVDHGKSTLTDSLIAAAGIISLEDAGNSRHLDARKDEQDKGVTIKSSGISLRFLMDSLKLPPGSEGNEFLINLIDSPGHVDFSSEVTAALRVTDGALIVVDCVEGICVQTETVLRQALEERIRPVLTINKLDRAYFELRLEPESMYQNFCRIIDEINTLFGKTTDETLGDITVHPLKGTVAFSAGKYGWAFTLPQFARMYAKKFGISEHKMLEKLWGDHFFDPETNKWTTSRFSKSGAELTRGFCKLIVEPIGKVLEASMTGDWTQLEKHFKSLGLSPKTEQRALTAKDLMKSVMQQWLPASEALMEMIVQHLPSPVRAQKYRVENLYTGPLDDETAVAIRNCDPEGPLVMYVSKHIPTKGGSRFYSFGRVFSGTIRTGQKVRILGPNYVYGQKVDLFENVAVQRTLVMMGDKSEVVSEVPCGCTVALVGIDTYLNKSGTIANSDSSHPLRSMKYSVSPVVKVAVEPKNPSDIPKLVDALKKLVNGDSLVECKTEPTGEHVIACAGELHLEICLNDLREYMNGIEIVVSNPVVPYQETVTDTSPFDCLAKSPNKHNRLYTRAMPLGEELTAAIETGQWSVNEEFKVRTRKLVENYGWDTTEARKIWAFGPQVSDKSSGTNVVVDVTRALPYMAEIKDSVVAGFQWVSKEGVLANEPLRGVRFNIMDATIHSDRTQRGGGQIIPSARRSFYASQMTAKPSILEPVFLVEITCPSEVIGAVQKVLHKRRGNLFEQGERNGGQIYIKAYMPVAESFGFTSALREETGGKAFPQCVFDHWEIVDGVSTDVSSKCGSVVQNIRKRKGLPLTVPDLSEYLDKL